MPKLHELNPAAGRSPPANPAVDVIVLAINPGLLEILQDAAGPEHVLWHARSADEAVDLLVGGHCGVLIADLQVLRTDAAALLERLQQQFPELVLLAVGRRDEEQAIGPLVTSGRVYRFLHKPVSAARASVFISAAARRHIELSTMTSPAMAAVRQLTQPAHRATYLGVIIAIVVLAGLWWQREPIERSFENLMPHPGDAVPQISERQLAAERKKKQVALLEKRVVDALQARDAPRAMIAFSALQKAAPAHPRLDELRAELLALSRSGTK